MSPLWETLFYAFGYPLNGPCHATPKSSMR